VLTGSPQEAEGLVQEVLAKSLRRWRRVRADNPVAYTRRVMINTHLTRWRRWGARVRLGDVPEAAADDAGLRRGEDWDALRRALARLPSQMRNSAFGVWRQTGKTGGGGLGARHCLLRDSTYLTAQPGVIAIPSMSGTLGTMICWLVPSRLASYTLPLHQKT